MTFWKYSCLIFLFFRNNREGGKDGQQSGIHCAGGYQRVHQVRQNAQREQNPYPWQEVGVNNPRTCGNNYQ